MRAFLLFGLLLGQLMLGNLVWGQNTAANSAPAPSVTGIDAIVGGNYIIRPLDVVEFRVFQEPTMQQQLRVAQDGMVTLPLVGRVRIGNMTIDSAQELITDLYDRDYLVNPQISLVVLSYKERRVFVHGQVGIPGPVLIPPEADLTLAQAISAAGGLTRLARRNPIRIKRQDKADVIEVNFNDVLIDPRTKDIPLLDGDIIFVDERIF